jgi:integrase
MPRTWTLRSGTIPLKLLGEGGWSLSGTCVVKRRGKFAVVAYAGVDPKTKKKRYRWFSGFSKENDAKQFQATLAHSPVCGAGGSSRVRLDDYLETWIAQRAALRSWRPKTIETVQLMHSYLSPQLGHMPLSRLSPTAIEAAYARLLTEVSPATVRRTAQTLTTALEDAVRLGIIMRNPARRVTPPTVEEYEPALLNPEQLRMYLADAAETATPALYALWVTKATCGLRLGELLGLAEDAVDLDRPLPTLRIDRQLTRAGRVPQFGRPKTRHGRRVVVLPDIAVKAIRAAIIWKKEQRLRLGPKFRDAGLLLCGPRGRPLNPSNIRNRDHHPRLTRLGLPHTRPHDFRHLNATEMAEADVSASIAATRLGHSNPAFTLKRYTHPRLEAQKRAADVANTLLVLPAGPSD